MITVQIDGQEFPVPAEIAEKDELLKAALAPFVPWVVNAQIDRKDDPAHGGQVVRVLKRADFKGSAAAVANRLIACPETVNPAIALWRRIHGEMDLNDPKVLIELEPAIVAAVAAGEREITAVQTALGRLVECAPAASTRIPLGF